MNADSTESRIENSDTRAVIKKTGNESYEVSLNFLIVNSKPSVAAFFSIVMIKLAKTVLLLSNKNHDYGTANISLFGLTGVIVRASDKIMRIKNLVIERNSASVKSESVKDTLDDLLGYSIIAKTEGDKPKNWEAMAHFAIVAGEKLSAQEVDGISIPVQGSMDIITSGPDFVAARTEVQDTATVVRKIFSENNETSTRVQELRESQVRDR